MLRGWFESTFGDSALAAQFVAALVIVVLFLAIIAWLFGKRSTRESARGPVRGRQPRLSVMEAATVDSRRRLILVRRDHVEHLVMIGGPSDIVVESNIVRGRPASGTLARGKQLAAHRAQAQHAAGQQQPQRYGSQQAPHPAPDRQIPAAASPSAAAMAAAVLSRSGETESHAVNTARARLVPSAPDGEAPAADAPGTGHPRSTAEQADEGTPHETLPEEAPKEDLAQTAFVPDEQHPFDDEPGHRDGSDAASSVRVAGLAAGAAALAAAAGSRSSAANAAPVESDTGSRSAMQNAESDVAPEDVSPQYVPEGLSDSAAETETATYAFQDSQLQTEEAMEEASEIRATVQDAQVEPEEVTEESAEDRATEAGLDTDGELPEAALPSGADMPDAGMQERIEPEELEVESEAEAEHSPHIAAADAGMQPETYAPAEDAETEPETSLPTLEADQPEVDTKRDPFADLESEFRRAFETSLRGLKDKVHAEPAPTGTDEPASTAKTDDAWPTQAEADEPHSVETAELSSLHSADQHTATADEQQPDPAPETSAVVADEPVAGAEIEADQPESTGAEAEAPQDEIRPAQSAEYRAQSAEAELLRSVAGSDAVADSPVTGENEVSPDPTPENGNQVKKGLPPELAFLDTPASESSEEQNADPGSELNEHAGEHPAESSASERTETAPMVADEEDPADVAIARNLEPDYPPAPRPGTNPFPTIPESVRKSVMAAASRAIPPELAAGLANGLDKDVATTTLGDLAQRLEKALSEQSEAISADNATDNADASDPLATLPSGHADDGEADEEVTQSAAADRTEPAAQEEGAVIDFNALRRDDSDESLEDEMAKLLNDLTGDANKAG